VPIDATEWPDWTYAASLDLEQSAVFAATDNPFLNPMAHGH